MKQGDKGYLHNKTSQQVSFQNTTGKIQYKGVKQLDIDKLDKFNMFVL